FLACGDEWRPEIHLGGHGQAPRHNSDNGIRSGVDADLLADDRWLLPVAAFPERIGQDGDRFGAWLRVLWGKGAADDRLLSEYGESIGGDRGRGVAFGCAGVVAQIHAVARRRAQAVEGFHLRLQVVVVRMGGAAEASRVTDVLRREVENPVAFGK